MKVLRIRLWAAAAVLAACLAAAVGCWVHRSYKEVEAFADRIYVPLSTDSGRQASVRNRAWHHPAETTGKAGNGADAGVAESDSPLAHVADLEQGAPFVLLFIGVDRRPGDRGRADALLVAALNPAKRSVLLVSIPRDTRTDLVGLEKPRKDKINHSFAFGGTESTVATAEQFLGIPISRYVQADMDGFCAMVDLVGGVRVDNDRAFEYEGFFFREGPIELDGEAALAYVRMRLDDPRGDLGRADRQKAVLGSLVKSALRPDRFRLWPELLEELSDHMKTDLSFRDWKALARHYRKAAETVETLQISGSGLMLEGIYYFDVPEEERKRIQRALSDHLAEAP